MRLALYLLAVPATMFVVIFLAALSGLLTMQGEDVHDDDY